MYCIPQCNALYLFCISGSWRTLKMDLLKPLNGDLRAKWDEVVSRQYEQMQKGFRYDEKWWCDESRFLSKRVRTEGPVSVTGHQELNIVIFLSAGLGSYSTIQHSDSKLFNIWGLYVSVQPQSFSKKPDEKVRHEVNPQENI